MANKKVSQLTSKPSVLTTDLFPIADPSTGQLFKTTISDLGTAIGSGVSSVNTLVGAVVLDTDDIQELASPTNKYFTDTRARAALSASSPLVYNSGTGAFSIPAATTSVNGYLTSTDWTTFNAKQAALSGTGFVKISGTTISYDNSTYLTTSSAASTYLPLAGGTMTGAIVGTTASFAMSGSGIALEATGSGTGDAIKITHSSGRAFTLNSSGSGFGVLINNDTASTSAPFTIQKQGSAVVAFTDAGAGTFNSSLTASSFVKSSGTSAQFLKADGSVDSSVYALDNTVVKLTGAQTVAGIKTMSNVFKLDDTLQIKNIAQLSNNTGYTGVWAETAAIGFYTGANAIRLLYAGNYNYTMPSADGTLALTSQLSAYLPLSGGTLTGALSGTSATFSDNVTINKAAALSILTIKSSSSTTGLWLYLNGLNATLSNQDNGSLSFQTNGTDRLTIASTGAATFSSSVTATQFNASISTSGAVASVPNLAYFKNQGSGYVAKIAIGEGTTSDSYISHTGGNTTATQLLGFGVNAYNQMVLTGAGNVGIGTTAPSALLHLQNSAGSTLRLVRTSNRFDISADNDFMEINARDASTYMTFKTADTERMRIRAGGAIGINSAGQDSVKLEVKGGGTGNTNYAALFADSSSNDLLFLRTDGLINTGTRAVSPYNNATSGRSMVVESGGGLGYLVSTRESKANIKPISSASFINKLNPVQFNYRKKDFKSNTFTEEIENTLTFGFIADEVEKVNKDLVFYNNDNSLAGVDYNSIIAILTKSVQELKSELDILKNK